MDYAGETMVLAPTAPYLMEGADKKHDIELYYYFVLCVSYTTLSFQKIIKPSKGSKMGGTIVDKKI